MPPCAGSNPATPTKLTLKTNRGAAIILSLTSRFKASLQEYPRTNLNFIADLPDFTLIYVNECKLHVVVLVKSNKIEINIPGVGKLQQAKANMILSFASGEDVCV